MDNRIDLRLAEARASRRTALAPFVTVGFPDVDTSVEIVAALAESGCDVIELGVPFSDPLAEGKTIQKTSLHALRQGVSVSTVVEVVRRLRRRGVDVPLVLMGYINPILSHGLERFADEVTDAGADGLIVADVPTEEAGQIRETCLGRGLYLIPLLAPTSSDRRIAAACKEASGFIYCVSLTGVTGARQRLRTGVSGLVGRIRRHTGLPVLVGFGISSRAHVEEVSRFADGVVVGSALLDAVDRAPDGMAVRAAVDFANGLRAADG